MHDKVWESVTARVVFGSTNPKELLTQMTVFLGPFPKELRERVEKANVIFTQDGKPPRNTPVPLVRRHVDLEMVADVHCIGYMNHAKAYPPQTLEESLQGSPERPKYESPLSEDERKDFLDFVRLTLTLDPQVRKSAKELMDHPWLHKEYECPKYESL